MRYRAFISYSHSDAAIVGRLHRWLESYRFPGQLRLSDGTRRLTPIFRDREELPTSSDLGSQLTAALESSKFLVVFCSPAAARSRWVNEEVASFIGRGLSDRIIAILIDGASPPAGPALPDEAFLTPALQAVWSSAGDPGSPRRVDLRSRRVERRSDRLQIVSLISGLAMEQLQQEDVRRGIRRAAAAGSLAIVVTLALTGLGLWAMDAARRALRETAVADAARLDAEAAADLARTAEAQALSEEKMAREATAFFTSMFSVNGSPATASNILFADLLERACRRLLPVAGSMPDVADAASRAKLLACFAAALSQIGRVHTADAAAQAVAGSAELLAAVDLAKPALLEAAAKTAINVRDYRRALGHLEQLRALRDAAHSQPDAKDLDIAIDSTFVAVRAGRPTAEVDEHLDRAAGLLKCLASEVSAATRARFLEVTSIVSKERHHDLAAAEQALREALAVMERSDGDGLPWARVAENLVLLRPDAADAIALAERALEHYTKILGRRHSTTTRGRVALGQALQVAGRTQDAITCLVDCLADARSQGPDGEHDARVAARLLAAAYLGNEQWTEAVAITEDLIAEAARRHMTEDVDYANILELHASALLRAGDFASATRSANQALELQRRLHGSQAPETCQALLMVAQARRLEGDAAGALEPLSQLVAILDTCRPPRHVQLAEAHTALAYVLETLRDHDAAASHADRAVVICDHEGVPDGTRACALLARARLSGVSAAAPVERLAMLQAAARASGAVGDQATSLQLEVLDALRDACVEAGSAAIQSLGASDSDDAMRILHVAAAGLEDCDNRGEAGHSRGRQGRLELAERAADAAQAALRTDFHTAGVLASAAESWLDKVASKRNPREETASATATLVRAQSDVLAGDADVAVERIDAQPAGRGGLPRELAVVQAVALGCLGRDDEAEALLRLHGLRPTEAWPSWAEEIVSVFAADTKITATTRRFRRAPGESSP